MRPNFRVAIINDNVIHLLEIPIVIRRLKFLSFLHMSRMFGCFGLCLCYRIGCRLVYLSYGVSCYRIIHGLLLKNFRCPFIFVCFFFLLLFFCFFFLFSFFLFIFFFFISRVFFFSFSFILFIF
jgi:hypothetical protein